MNSDWGLSCSPLLPHPRPFFLHEHPKGRNASCISFFAKNLMDLGICKPLAPEFYDTFLARGQFAGNSRIVMAICNAVAGVQVILYGLICVVHHGSNPPNRISFPLQFSGFINFLLFLLQRQLVLPFPGGCPVLRNFILRNGKIFSDGCGGDECSNSAISDTVRPSFRFLWANLIRRGLFAVLYRAAISSETASASGISALAGNSLMIYLFMASESPFIRWNWQLTCTASGWESVAADE